MDPNFIHELFAGFGAVEIRRLFGGAGLFADGVMFGLVSRGEIYLKADAETAPRFAAEGCGAFEYGTKTGKRAIGSFRRLPARLYDDADELADWARAALAIGRRKAEARPAKQPRREKPSARIAGARTLARKSSSVTASLHKSKSKTSRAKKPGSKPPRRRAPS